MRVLSLLVVLFAAFAAANEEPEIDVQSVTETESTYAPKDTFTETQRTQIEETQETHEFQAEVSRLMDIIINSLYSNREIFLRELISNAADALDKVRFLSLTDEALLADNDKFEIKIRADKARKTITITDTGVGMTKENLQKNLGIVAKSGTTEFLEKAASEKAGGDSLSLIGQFGVGFYSVYLVADRVTVVSKHHDDQQYIWESTAQNTYTVSPDPRGNTLGRGTSIILHLKPDAEEYLEGAALEKLVMRYSQFINFPIFLHEIEEVEKEVPIEKVETEEIEKSEDDEDLEVSEDDDEPKTETIIEEIESWRRLNDVQPIWTKSPSDVTDEEYDAFYKTLTKSSEPALEKMHFIAEGEISFRALLYIPKSDSEFFQKYHESSKSNIKLYVRRVLISDEFDDFLPNYMGFVKGVVDSDDLPLNVSRETLAQSRVLKVMGKKLTRKVLEMFRKMAERSEKEEDKEDAEDVDADKSADVDEETDYDVFWKNYGKAIKMGAMEDQKNKSKLTKLLRFKTTKSKGKYISLEQYVDNMQEQQTAIWYVTGEDDSKIKANPVLEGFTKRDIEVLILDEAVDEFCIQHIHEFDGMTPKNAARQNPSAWKESMGYLQDKESAEPLTKWMKGLLGDAVKEVFHSPTLIESPAVITSSMYGNTGNMERIQVAQALSDAPANGGAADKNLEINWRHPIIKEIGRLVEADAEDKKAKEMTWVLFHSAQIYSGFILHETEDFAKRINRVVSLGLGVDPDASADDEANDPEVEEEAEEETEDDEDVEEIPDQAL